MTSSALSSLRQLSDIGDRGLKRQMRTLAERCWTSARRADGAIKLCHTRCNSGKMHIRQTLLQLRATGEWIQSTAARHAIVVDVQSERLSFTIARTCARKISSHSWILKGPRRTSCHEAFLCSCRALASLRCFQLKPQVHGQEDCAETQANIGYSAGLATHHCHIRTNNLSCGCGCGAGRLRHCDSIEAIDFLPARKSKFS